MISFKKDIDKIRAYGNGVTALITGASSGMGICFAKQLLSFRNFDEMWLIARRKDRLDELAEQIGKEKCFVLISVRPTK